MTSRDKLDLCLGSMPLSRKEVAPAGSFVELMGETYYRISHVDRIPTFLMSLVSSGDHWMFVASNGGLTAGRINADSALFPYETEDKVAANSERNGSKTLLQVTRNGRAQLWEPFSNQYAGLYGTERHLYKNSYGNKLIFEEVNHDLQLTMRFAWRTGSRFGFIKSSWLQNDGETPCEVNLLDGLQNVLPFGTTAVLQNTMSSLLQAYKRSELEPDTGLGIFTLSATLTDRAEPSESLQATVVWQTGLDNLPTYLLSTDQVEGFGYGHLLTQELDIRGKSGAYLVNDSFQLPPGQVKEWHIVADVNQDSTAVTHLIRLLQQDQMTIKAQLEADIDQGTSDLIRYVAAADGLQLSARKTTAVHHFANVLFNIMRGGIFVNGYQIERDDLLDFLHVRNRDVLNSCAEWLAALPEVVQVHELYAAAAETGNPDLIRLCYEYLPLTFSRRHGDPSRPWNHFSINLKKPDGSPQLDYQGNWRDIFQNWEPLLFSFPDYLEGVIAKFLNATTADGYNPYRVTRSGIEWEVPEPDNPWSNIGYWSDHQIIYLQKLLELVEHVHPGSLAQQWNRPVFAYADVPYRLRPYEQMVADWTNTIDFDWEKHAAIEDAVSRLGTDGRLLHDASGKIVHVTMTEKLLVLLLTKLTNLAPDGGIWMNTQRPEWNDANNALVGKGLSVVTAAYLRRFITFWLAQLPEGQEEGFVVNSAVAALFEEVQSILKSNEGHLENGFTSKARQKIMDMLGTAVTTYRAAIYDNGIPNSQGTVEAGQLRGFLTLAQTFIDHTLEANRRPDGLTHSYNVLRLDENGASVENLYLMLEGQVALLSSGLLTTEEAVKVLDALRQSALYRSDQHSYMLYPNRTLPNFRQKNNVTANHVASSALVSALRAAGDTRLLIRDEENVFHFNGRFRNANDVAKSLDDLEKEPPYADLVRAEREFVLNLFEETFNHRAFTGRSGTFFAYEGLGSIYWHMVSKLLLAVQECYFQAVNENAGQSIKDDLAAAYYDIRAGLSFNKSPDVYGAFPTDPYSHTPMGSGARQPGMTGQVKEEILTRWGELGVTIINGAFHFSPTLLQPEEFTAEAARFDYVDLAGGMKTIAISPNSLAFTLCQTPVVYTRGEIEQITMVDRDGRTTTISGKRLGTKATQHILDRDGQIQLVNVIVNV